LENVGTATPRRPDIAAILRFHEDTLYDEYDSKDISDIMSEWFRDHLGQLNIAIWNDIFQQRLHIRDGVLDGEKPGDLFR
jgi:hypothetical protein